MVSLCFGVAAASFRRSDVSLDKKSTCAAGRQDAAAGWFGRAATMDG